MDNCSITYIVGLIIGIAFVSLACVVFIAYVVQRIKYWKKKGINLRSKR